MLIFQLADKLFVLKLFQKKKPSDFQIRAADLEHFISQTVNHIFVEIYIFLQFFNIYFFSQNFTGAKKRGEADLGAQTLKKQRTVKKIVDKISGNHKKLFIEVFVVDVDDPFEIVDRADQGQVEIHQLKNRELQF